MQAILLTVMENQRHLMILDHAVNNILDVVDLAVNVEHHGTPISYLVLTTCWNEVLHNEYSNRSHKWSRRQTGGNVTVA